MKKKALVGWAVAVIAAVLVGWPTSAFAAQGASSGYTYDSVVIMQRLYNRWTGEHLYTSDAVEKNGLMKLGWTDEGIAWYAPESSSTPVYRLYNPFSGDHHYTTDKDEYKRCAEQGWRQEGVGWYSADAATGEKLYRGYNRYAVVGTHHYTSDWSEMSTMVSHGWDYEGVAWYGIPFKQISW